MVLELAMEVAVLEVPRALQNPTYTQRRAKLRHSTSFRLRSVSTRSHWSPETEHDGGGERWPALAEIMAL
eukprot:4648710-Alexandrium_andersonii.AAC.1